MQTVNFEQEIRRILELPLGERARYGNALLQLSTSFITNIRPRVVRRSEFDLRGHGEDIANETLLNCHLLLQKMYLGRDGGASALRDDETLIEWVSRIRSNCSANYRRKQTRHRVSNPVSVHEEGFAEADVSAVDGETYVILSETLEEPQFELQVVKELFQLNPAVPAEIYSGNNLPLVEAALAKFPEKRDVFLFRVRSGIHSFEALHTQALLQMARDLRLGRATLQSIRRVAKRSELGCGKILASELAGDIFSISDRRVRGVVQGVVESILTIL